MTKTETNTINTEIRNLKKALTARQKDTQREIKKNRNLIRETEKEITNITKESTLFELQTNTRLAILEGRLKS